MNSVHRKQTGSRQAYLKSQARQLKLNQEAYNKHETRALENHNNLVMQADQCAYHVEASNPKVGIFWKTLLFIVVLGAEFALTHNAATWALADTSEFVGWMVSITIAVVLALAVHFGAEAYASERTLLVGENPGTLKAGKRWTTGIISSCLLSVIALRVVGSYQQWASISSVMLSQVALLFLIQLIITGVAFFLLNYQIFQRFNSMSANLYKSERVLEALDINQRDMIYKEIELGDLATELGVPGLWEKDELIEPQEAIRCAS